MWSKYPYIFIQYRISHAQRPVAYNYQMDEMSVYLGDFSYGSGLGDNNTNDAESEEIGSGVAILFLRILVCVVGEVGNLLVVFVVLVLQDYKKTITHWYVLHLAIADSIFLLTIPFNVVEDATGHWTFPNAMCKIKESLFYLNYFASVILLVVMSLDRYIAVCHMNSTTLLKFRSRRSAYIATALVWLTSLLFCTPIFVYSENRGLEPHCKCQNVFPRDLNQSCIEKGFTEEIPIANCIKKEQRTDSCTKSTHFTDMWETEFFGNFDDGSTITSDYDNGTTVAYEVTGEFYELGCQYVGQGPGLFTYLNFMFSAMFLLPLLVMTICYTLIIVQLRKSQARHYTVTSGSQRQGKKRPRSAAALNAESNFKRVNITCIALVLLFFVCWLPFHSYHIAMRHGIKGSTKFCEELMLGISILVSCNSALNPYIYNFFGTRFGTRLRKALDSVQASVKKRTASLSSVSGPTVRYRPKRDRDNSTTSGTLVTKLQTGVLEQERDDLVVMEQKV